MSQQTARPGQFDQSDVAQVRPRTRTHWAIAGSVLGLGVAAWFVLGQDGRGASERVSEAFRTISQGVSDASSTVRSKYAEARASAHNHDVEQQIRMRILGEKALDPEKVEVKVVDQGTAILTGIVPDASSKDKAVALTRDTRGVLRVVDHLAVLPRPRVIAASPDPSDDDVRAVAVRPQPFR